jgi:regulator of RNase E activity RraB
MIGKLHKKENTWVVQYKMDFDFYATDGGEIPVYPGDAIYCFEIDNNKEVEFEIIDEFSHSHLYEGVGWGDGITYAKLK